MMVSNLNMFEAEYIESKGSANNEKKNIFTIKIFVARIFQIFEELNQIKKTDKN